MKKQLIILLLLISFFITGCAKPTYYTNDEIVNYVNLVFGNNYSLKEIKTKEKNNEKAYEYIFKDNLSSFTFSVTSSTTKTSKSLFSNIYQKELTDNFINKKLDEVKTTTDKLLEESKIKYKQHNEYISLYLTNYNEFTKASRLIEKLDNSIALEYNYKNWNNLSYNETYKIKVYLKPTIIDYDWQKKEDYLITTIELSTSKDYRLKRENVKEILEYELINKNNNFYTIEETLYNKYPPKYIYINKVNNQEISDYKFEYDIKTKNYWIYDLDPCQDSSNLSYNYSPKGKFKKLVELLGGTYKSHDYIATYKLNNSTYEMKLVVDEYDYYKNITITKDNKSIILSNPENKNNNTISGRAYTKKDLEKMLDIEIIINENSGQATIITK